MANLLDQFGASLLVKSGVSGNQSEGDSSGGQSGDGQSGTPDASGTSEKKGTSVREERGRELVSDAGLHVTQGQGAFTELEDNPGREAGPGMTLTSEVEAVPVVDALAALYVDTSTGQPVVPTSSDQASVLQTGGGGNEKLGSGNSVKDGSAGLSGNQGDSEAATVTVIVIQRTSSEVETKASSEEMSGKLGIGAWVNEGSRVLETASEPAKEMSETLGNGTSVKDESGTFEESGMPRLEGEGMLKDVSQGKGHESSVVPGTHGSENVELPLGVSVKPEMLEESEAGPNAGLPEAPVAPAASQEPAAEYKPEDVEKGISGMGTSGVGNVVGSSTSELVAVSPKMPVSVKPAPNVLDVVDASVALEVWSLAPGIQSGQSQGHQVAVLAQSPQSSQPHPESLLVDAGVYVDARVGAGDDSCERAQPTRSVAPTRLRCWFIVIV